MEIEKEIPQHDKYMTPTVFNKLMKDNFVKRSKQAYLASKKDSADFIKKTDVDEKLIKILKKRYLKKEKKKLNDNITSYIKLATNINKRINARFDKWI